MVLKPLIRNSHREMFAAGDFDKIPPVVLEMLRAQAAPKSGLALATEHQQKADKPSKKKADPEVE